MVTSVTNDKVKYARSLVRKRERDANQAFLIEGVRLIQEADRAGFNPALVFYQPGSIEKNPTASLLLAKLRSRTTAVYSVSERVMTALAQTQSPQGIAAVYPLPRLPRPESPQLVLVADQVRDPGNLGTMLRTALAAGVDLVLLAPETVDPFNDKVVRAAMGAHFHLPIYEVSWDEIGAQLKSVPRVYLAETRGAASYTEVDWSHPCALIIGGEAQGASRAARQFATKSVSIPMPGPAESLNAAVAAGILLFEAIRAPQRR